MKKWLKQQAARLLRDILPPEPPRRADPPQLSPDRAADILKNASPEYQAWRERVHEMEEAKQLAGAGPWLPAGGRAQLDRPGKFRETAFANQTWTADIELALSNVEWRREINLSWLEFSRWGIQQIILQCRLQYMKHPWIRRGVNLSAAYVFGQGVELSSPDPDANEQLKQFRERNKAVLGQIALCGQERSKSTDGNLFTALFADTESTGDVNLRTIDAMEIMDIVTNPEDSTEEWYFRRVWTQRLFDPASGYTSTATAERWYPALNFEPTGKPLEEINGIPVDWNMRVHHRKCGAIANWIFGCPRIFPALDDCREGRKFLNNWASVWAALRQIALTVTTKGGQQALEGVKNQWQTSVGPTSNLLDNNPPSVAGSMFASGPGTVLSAFKTQGSGGDPKEICELRNMVACVLEIPPTWLGDMETSNLSTAQTLDRPTELGFLLKQEEWQEDLVIYGIYALKVAAAASGSKFKEALDMRKVGQVHIAEAARKMVDCHWVYEAKKQKKPSEIEVVANFPSIREGDQTLRVAAIVNAMTLANKGGQIIGIDEKAGVRELYDALGIKNGDEKAEEQYPDGEYEPDRTKEILPPPIGRAQLAPGGKPQAQPDDVPGADGRAPEPTPKKESAVNSAAMHLRRQGQPAPRPSGTIQRVLEALKALEAENGTRPNGHA